VTVTRRGLFKAGTGVLIGAGIAGPGQAAPAAPVTDDRPAVVRALGRNGERLPAIGLGAVPGARGDSLRAVLRAHWAAGGRVVDTSRLRGDSERLFSEVATELGIAGDVFVTHQLAPAGTDAGDVLLTHRLRAAQTRLRRGHVDVLRVGDLADAAAAVPVLGRWKSEGSVRHVAVGHHATQYYPAIEILMRNFDVDVVQVRYSILTRLAEEHILPLAAQRGIGVIATMPMEGGRLHRLVDGRPVPGWAADFGATTWGQFFLKYVLGHPAVSVVVPSSGSPAHVEENMRALRGPVPDDEQRTRMVEHLAGLAGFADLADD
jgi:aryl-alcohol dehydrogenase-like predicted oxidoreductase